MMHDLMATRAHGLRQLHAFIPAMGAAYAKGRNYDHGPGKHEAVSRLSPYLRRRLVTECEVVAAAIAAHGSQASEKFVQEVVWRTYFKGWLERRPQVWTSYVRGLEGDLLALGSDRQLRTGVDRALHGDTGIACFDAWAAELIETGYLHNHARMWFASIWIFTLGLPWRLGADFFYRHLLDGDAASNTLSWRWVAGLHTRGKPYAALAANITTYTHGRFSPRPRDLVEDVQGLEASEPDGLPAVLPLRSVLSLTPGRPTAVLITDEDCGLEGFSLQGVDVCGAATLASSHLRSPLAVSNAVLEFEGVALSDAAARLGFAPARLSPERSDVLVDWVEQVGATQIITPYVTRGPLSDWLEDARARLGARGVRFAEWRRDWDAAFWPHATAGFFKVKQQIPHILAQLGLCRQH